MIEGLKLLSKNEEGVEIWEFLAEAEETAEVTYIPFRGWFWFENMQVDYFNSMLFTKSRIKYNQQKNGG